MTIHPSVPSDPDLRGVPDALLRAAEKARRLAEQTGTPFIMRQPTYAALRDTETDAAKSSALPANGNALACAGTPEEPTP